MRGELDDALARLRRWDEVRQRLAGETPGAKQEAAAPVVPEAAPAPPPLPTANPLPVAAPVANSLPEVPQGTAAVPPAAPDPQPVPSRAVEDVVNAIGEAMQRNRGTAVAVTIEDESSSWTVYLVPGEDGQPVVTRLQANHVAPASAGSAPAQWPLEGGQPGESAEQAARQAEPPRGADRPERTASRLSDLIRRDPGMGNHA